MRTNIFYNKVFYEKLIRLIALVAIDSLVINISVALSILIRFELNISHLPLIYLHNLLLYIPMHTAVTLLIFYLFRLYNSLWQFAGIREAAYIFYAILASIALHFAGSYLTGLVLPKSCYIISGMILFVLTVFSRFMYRILRYIKNHEINGRHFAHNIMLIGAGNAGIMLIREINNSWFLRQNKIICIIDDDKNKVGKYIDGIKIVGTRDNIIEAAKNYCVDEIIFAIPSAPFEIKADILKICQKTGCVLKTLPGVYQLINGEITIDKIRKVEIEDLLGREPIKVDLCNIMDYVKGKTVLITGGGGSIGSELCRQIAMYLPKQIIIFDIYENNAYEIQSELIRRDPGLNISVLIGSVRDKERLEAVFDDYKPEIVYHAAAHKHVPLMENCPNESIKNNVFGTLNTVQAADKYGCERFVLISTDKAVNPTNIMGATKRICEMIIQEYNNKSKTEFVAVRFGNVLGSNGSVIPQFKRQIEEGGPVTVTHPEITRYFMTIPEAVSLVLQAGAFAKGGEIFVLDMGKPVKILDLAENIIRLSNYIPYIDIDIKFTGLRPGEKLYEELLLEEEGLRATDNNHIFIAKPIEFDRNKFYENLQELKLQMSNEQSDVRKVVKRLVPNYMVLDNSNNDNHISFIPDKTIVIRKKAAGAADI